MKDWQPLTPRFGQFIVHARGRTRDRQTTDRSLAFPEFEALGERSHQDGKAGTGGPTPPKTGL